MTVGVLRRLFGQYHFLKSEDRSDVTVGLEDGYNRISSIVRKAVALDAIGRSGGGHHGLSQTLKSVGQQPVGQAEGVLDRIDFRDAGVNGFSHFRRQLQVCA